MAYHTRRSGGPPGVGRGFSLGRGAPPVMYPQRSGTRSPASNYGNSRNSMESHLQSEAHHQSLGQRGPQNSYQQHQTQQQQQQQPQQQQQQQQPKPQPQIKFEEPPQLQPVPPPINPFASDTGSKMDIDGSGDVKREDGDEGNETKAKPWLRKKVPGFKINKKVKRRRQNARLRKILQPKNAIMVLNELKTGIKFTFQEHTNALTQTMFVVNAEVDGKSYSGQGLSKPLAKQNAAENALKDLLLQKMADAAMKVVSEVETIDTPMIDNNSVGDTDSVDGNSEIGKPAAPEDDVPWGSLASFALYKLFTEWQSQGTHVPLTKTPAATTTTTTTTSQAIEPVKTAAPAPMKKIPDNPTERHPVMLLNQLRPGVEFKEVSREGSPPNLVFTLCVTVDGASYTGVAKNKKDAKKEAAKAALAGSFNINYE